MNQNKINTTQIIEDVVNKTSSDRISISDLLAAMHATGFGLAMMVFAFGVLIPMPPPIPSIIAIPLLIFSLQMILGYPSPRLPQMISRLSIKRSLLASMIQKSSPYIRKVERVLRPRFIFMTSTSAERIIGFLTLIFSISIALPVPFSNFIPGLGVLIISFGMMGKDGLMVFYGIVVGIIGVTISTVVIMVGVEAIYYVKNFLVNLF